jgi:uncharacterized protein (TIGR00369 family)
MESNGTRARRFTWQDPAPTAVAGRELRGLELLRAIVAGALPPPPIAELLEMSLLEVADGRAVFALQPAEWMYNPIGSVHGGIAATILDSCMGCAVHTTLPAGVGYTTSDIQIRYVRGMTLDTGRVIAEGNVVHRGRRMVTAEGRLLAQDSDKLLAHATCACILID